LRQELGLAAKVVDGTRRAAPPAVIATLKALGALDDGALASLGEFARPEVYNVAGRTVGHVEARLPDTISATKA
jgi:L-asparaginase II